MGNSIKIAAANTIWMVYLWLKSRRFFKEFEDLELIQKRKLMEYISKNSSTKFGREYNFREIDSIQKYREQLPIVDYSDIESYCRDILNGKNSILTAEKVKLVEPTSGTTSACKYIPYTESLKSEFMEGVMPWIFDSYMKKKRLFFTTAYWSISPKVKREALNGVTVGFENDGDYFSKFENMIFKTIFTVPDSIAEISDIDDFRYATIAILTADKNLGFISVWNPTFFTLMADSFFKNYKLIICNIREGKLTLPNGTGVPEEIAKKFKKNPKRAAELERITEKFDKKQWFKQIWKKFSCLSCWTDSNAAIFAERAAEIIGSENIEGKGLLATECIVTIPIRDKKLLSYRSHFFEFKEIERGELKSAGDVEIGKEYLVIVTTAGGFYRYNLGDIVKVTGFYRGVPHFEFIGKSGKISDYFGEKLTEGFVASEIKSVLEKYKLTPKIIFIAPVNRENFYYMAYIEPEKDEKTELYSGAVNEIEEGLRKNFHYNYARELGQIGKLKFFKIDSDGISDYLRVKKDGGMKLGDIKPSFLETKDMFEGKFKGNEEMV